MFVLSLKHGKLPFQFWKLPRMKFTSQPIIAGTLLFLTIFSLPVLSQDKSDGRILDSIEHRLGERAKTDSPAAEETNRVEVRFDARANAQEAVIGITQTKVTGAWTLQLNGNPLATIKEGRDPEEFFYPAPPGSLEEGENILTIARKSARGSLFIGPIKIYAQTLRERLKLAPVVLTVSDSANGKSVPARVTITDSRGKTIEIYYAENTNTAVRRGIVYTVGTDTHLELPEGDYNFYATRGMEWSRGEKTISLHQNKTTPVRLKIRREVDTTRFIAADTHIHTLTFSGHGDASVPERMVTLAGEGVEMAVATDHNHNTDYLPYQQELTLNKYFTSVTGNEVTTPIGHMNAFPLNAKDPVPSHELTNWVQLVDEIRAKGAKVVILNHPRWPTIATSPFTKFGLNRSSGDFVNGWDFPFDGMELANALTPQPDPLYLFHDWFALLNRGEKITGIGSSDSHTVGDPVGQGRSYVPSKTDNPAKIDVDDACGHFLRGETSISLGIFADVRVNDRYKMGQTLSVKKGSVNVRLRVASSSWVTPRRAIIFLNGQQVVEKPVPTSTGHATDTWMNFSIPAPKHDTYLVCVVLGDGVSHPSWRTTEKFTLAATNPIFLDADGDRKYSSPREQAGNILARTGDNFENQWQAVTKADDVIAVQMASLMRHLATGKERDELDQRLRAAASQRPLFQEYVRYALPELKAEAQ